MEAFSFKVLLEMLVTIELLDPVILDWGEVLVIRVGHGVDAGGRGVELHCWMGCLGCKKWKFLGGGSHLLSIPLFIQVSS